MAGGTRRCRRGRGSAWTWDDGKKRYRSVYVLADQVQQSILEFNPSNEEAGSWLTLYYAERQEWTQLLNSCKLWTPEITHHPVWLEAKLRALIGLGKLEEAYKCWTLLSQESVKRLFIEPMLSLAESQKNGPLSLELLDLLGTLVTEAEEESGEKEIAEPLSSLTLEDSPPPLPNLDEVFDGVEHSMESDESISELSSLIQNLFRYIKDSFF